MASIEVHTIACNNGFEIDSAKNEVLRKKKFRARKKKATEKQNFRS